MLLTRSLRRRIVVAAGAALGFVLLYESPIFDSEYMPRAFRRTVRSETPVLHQACRIPRTSRRQRRG